MALRLRIEGTTFRDGKNREVTLHGINAAGDAKFPYHPDQPSHVKQDFFDGDNVSFVGRPFAVDEAPMHFARLRHWGYNTIRYIFTWEAIEAAGPGHYDEDWIQHTISVLRKAKEFDFHVFMDPHQDVVRSQLPVLESGIDLIYSSLVVKVHWWIGRSYVDSLRMRPKSRRIRRHRGCPDSEYMAKARRVPKDDMGHQL